MLGIKWISQVDSPTNTRQIVLSCNQYIYIYLFAVIVLSIKFAEEKASPGVCVTEKQQITTFLTSQQSRPASETCRLPLSREAT